MMTSFRVLAAGCCLLWASVAVVLATDACAEGCRPMIFVSGLLVLLAWAACSVAVRGVFSRGLARWLWLSAPAVVLAGLAAGATDRGLALRVRLCERELTAFAEAVRAGDEKVSFGGPKRCVGLFFVHGTDAADEGVVRLTTSVGLLWSYEVVYAPEGVPPGMAAGFQPLYGPWYYHAEDF